MNSKHAFLALSVFTLVSIAHGEREVFAPTKLAPTATAGTVRFGDGTAAAPSISFSDDINTGIFSDSGDSNVLAMSTNGTERMRISTTGQVQVNGGATSLPSSTDSTVAVASGGYATTSNISNAIYGSIRGLLLLGGNYTAGTADVAGIKFLYGPRSTTSENTAAIASVVANNTDTTANSGGSVLISTRPASGTLTERMRIDSTGLVGIGTTPSVLLDVLNPSTAASSEVARFRSDTAATPYVSFFNGASRTGIIQYSASNLFLTADANKNVQITTTGTGALTQSTGGTERIRITSGGEIVAGNGDTSATPAASTIRGTDGSGTNIAAANLTIQGGRGTGTGAGGAVVFQTSAAGTSGSTLNAATERVRIKAGGQLRFVPLAAAPTVSVEDGDVYYNSTTNKLQVRAAGVWVDLH